MRTNANGLNLLVQPERAEASLWRRFEASPNAPLRECLFERYRNFARAIARGQARRHGFALDRCEDLEQLAYSGLLEAIDRFDPRRGAPFPAFAKRRIVGSIMDGLRLIDEQGAQLKFKGRVEQERLASLVPSRNVKASATRQLSDVVTELAIALMLDMEDRNEHSAITGRPENGFDSLAWRETKALLSQRVDELPEPERSVVRHHYQHDMLFTQIAGLLGLSKGRVSQIHKSALARLRKSMRSIR
jgi:RNA polymerase sigma factor for flagellar operon FliA